MIGLRVGGNNVVGNRDVADTTRINDGQWHHVAVVINLGQTVQFYIDGALSTSQTMPTVAASNSVPLWIGTPPFPYFGQPFTGALDNVEIDNQALSAAAIAQLAALMHQVAPLVQIIAATQSPTFANHFGWEDFIVVDRVEDASRFRRLAEDEIAPWAEAFGMGEIWEKNLVGGRP